MTREEAIEELERLLSHWDDLENVKRSFRWYSKDAVGLAITALRPVSREQVEKVWRGEWNNINPAVLKPGVSWVCRCAKCGCPQDYKHNFCPNCGAAQTDEAVEMVMERWKEAVVDEA